MGRISRFTSVIITVVAAILLLIWTTYNWYKTDIINQDNFTKKIVEVIQTEEVRNSISTKIVDRALEGRPLAKNVIGDYAQSAISGLIGSTKFQPYLEEATKKFHEVLILDEPKDIVLNISPIVDISTNILKITSRGQAEIPQDMQTDLENISSLEGEVTLITKGELPSLHDFTYTMTWLGPLAGFLSIILFVYVLWASKDRIQAVVNIGVFISSGVLLYLLAIPYFQSIVTAASPNEISRTFINVIFEVFSGDLIAMLKMEGAFGLFVMLIGFVLSIFFYSSPKPSSKKKLTK